MNWRDRISATPDLCHGKPCIRGTRVLVSTILDDLADGATTAEIVRSFPSIQAVDVQAALLYVAELARGAVFTSEDRG